MSDTISVQALLHTRFPGFSRKPWLLRKAIVLTLSGLLREKRINALMQYSAGRLGLGFNDALLDYLELGYSATGAEQIPASGPLVVVANHPLGALDGAALIQLVSRVRPDVRMVVSDILLQFRPARDILLPVDNLSGRNNRSNVDGIDAALARGEAVIIFPSGEVSRASPKGIRDGLWRTGFLRVAKRAGAPILPVHISGRNSLGFYAWSMLYKPLAMLLLAREVFAKQGGKIQISIGTPISWPALEAMQLSLPEAAAHLREHIYTLRPQPAHKLAWRRKRALAKH